MEDSISYQRGEYTITCGENKVDVEKVLVFLADSYWASTRPQATIRKSIKNSLCFSLYHLENQIGFARIVTDYSVYAHLCDVYIDAAYRRRGLGTWFMKCIMAHPELQGLRRWSLATKDAHGFYQQFGFKNLGNPGDFMEIFNA